MSRINLLQSPRWRIPGFRNIHFEVGGPLRLMMGAAAARLAQDGADMAFLRAIVMIGSLKWCSVIGGVLGIYRALPQIRFVSFSEKPWQG